MELNINNDKKLVEVWLTNTDQADEQMQAQLSELYKDYKQRGYFVAVFRSGKHDLFEQTSSLLIYNRKRIAELEVTREKALAQSASAT